jgi:hypothetical protein
MWAVMIDKLYFFQNSACATKIAFVCEISLVLHYKTHIIYTLLDLHKNDPKITDMNYAILKLHRLIVHLLH